MTFEELMEKVKGIAERTDVSEVEDLAVQVNVSGKDPGTYYVEVKDHKTTIGTGKCKKPDSEVTMSLSDMNLFLDGKLNPMMAYFSGRLKAKGDLGKLMVFSSLFG